MMKLILHCLSYKLEARSIQMLQIKGLSPINSNASGVGFWCSLGMIPSKHMVHRRHTKGGLLVGWVPEFSCVESFECLLNAKDAINHLGGQIISWKSSMEMLQSKCCVVINALSSWVFAGDPLQREGYWSAGCQDFHVFLGGKGSLLQSMDTTDYVPLVWMLPLVRTQMFQDSSPSRIIFKESSHHHHHYLYWCSYKCFRRIYQIWPSQCTGFQQSYG